MKAATDQVEVKVATVQVESNSPSSAIFDVFESFSGLKTNKNEFLRCFSFRIVKKSISIFSPQNTNHDWIEPRGFL